MSSVEDKYLDVLQNMEYSIVGVYYDHPDLSDFQVDQALELLGRAYLSEKGGKSAPHGKSAPQGKPVPIPRSELAQKVYEALKHVCDWRLGREQIVDEEGQPLDIIEPLTIDEVLICLKRIRKSVSLWNKEGGSQGYLNYIRHFLPK